MKKKTVLALFLVGTLVAMACEAAAPSSSNASPSSPERGSRYEMRVDAQGYHPDRVAVHAGQPMTLVVTRVSDQGCGQQLVIPSLGIRRDLPLDQPVEIALTPTRGEIAFTCGMNMLRGTIVAQ